MKRFLAVLLLLFSSAVFAQKMVDKNIEVGMYVHINKCPQGKKSFENIDLYTKTRYPEAGIKIDSVTGDGIFENFFAPGDFDAKRLPASYGNKKYKIAALRIFEEDDGKERRVMICYTGKKLSMIWIEMDKALEAKEISF
jgi:hypothetical protein